MPTIEPKNLSAQLAYRGRGNPPSTHPSSAIANCFPGLETDFRNLWKRFLVGVEFHEALNTVVAVEAGSAAAQAGVTANHALTSVAGVNLLPFFPAGRVAWTLDWSNIVAPLQGRAGQTVACEFRIPGGAPAPLVVNLEIRRILTPDTVAIEPDAAEPGALTQSLCSPWQADYRECLCFYWAASRPDFVNVEAADGVSRGHNWMTRNRTAATPKNYIEEGQPGLVTYEDLYRSWESMLRFVVGGNDAD